MFSVKKSLTAAFLLTIIIPFQNCGQPFVLAPMEALEQASETGSGNQNIDVLLKDGQALYAQNCMSCHGSLLDSTKINRSASQISTAINGLAPMSSLKGLLSNDEVQAIAVALERKVEGNPFACSTDRTPSADPLRRLSKEEYINTLNDLFGGAITASELQSQLNQFPQDTGDDGNPFDRGVRAVNSGIFNAHTAVASRVGDILSADAVKRSRIFSDSCFATNPASDTCVNNFIQSFGKKALRRPVDTAERTLLLRAYRIGDSPADSAKYLTRALLLHPSFLYHTEYKGQVVSGTNSLYNISSYELAARLSYLVTGSLPDPSLMAKADDQSILQSDVLAAEATRLLASTKAKQSFRRFYKKYLVLDTLKSPAYSPNFRENISLSNLNEEAIEEMLSFTDYVTLGNRPLSDLLTSRVGFVRSANLASLYGVSVGNSADGRITLPAERSGALTRAGFLLSGNDTTNPIHRGFVVRNSLLCDDIPSPDPNLLPPGSLEHPPLDLNMTTRQRWTQKTSGPACIGCHTQINPLGFALEGFDGIGRVRSQESIYDNAGNLIRRLPVDTVVSPSISNTNERNVNGSTELSLAMVNSQKFNACFVKKWHQFAMRKKVGPQDGCLTAQLYNVLKRPDGTPLEMIKALIEHPNFRQRQSQ